MALPPPPEIARRVRAAFAYAGRAGGRGVAVWLRDADGDAKAVVAGCLSP